MKWDIGKHKRDEAAATRQRVKVYMEANPLARQQECAKDLGLSTMTVSRHIGALRAEWLAEREKAGANG